MKKEKWKAIESGNLLHETNTKQFDIHPFTKYNNNNSIENAKFFVWITLLVSHCETNKSCRQCVSSINEINKKKK